MFMPLSDSDYDASGGGLVAGPRPGDNSEPLSITAISAALKRTVEDRFGYVRLRGELSGVKRAASGHFYCSLKDEGAVIDAVMWKGSAQRLSFRPEDGVEVIATGKITTYPGRSKYQIVMESMEVAGEGALLALLEKNRQRFAAEGLFANERPLPFIPRRIGVVTSPTGAVIRDILHRLADRFPSHVLVWPVLVQGQGAAEQVAAAVRGFAQMPEDQRPDLLIVARGGGSIEDLWAFNEEAVVRAVAGSPIPVISAVGHETDTTLCDFAADRRAPTPTAAAEMAVPVRADLVTTLAELALRKRRGVLRPVQLGRERLAARAERLPKPPALLQAQAQKLDDLALRLQRALLDRAAAGRERLARLRLSPAMLQRSARDAAARLERVRLTPALVTRPLADRRQQLAALARLADQLHPDKPLARGYAMVLNAAGKTVTSRARAATEPQLAVRFADGELAVVPLGQPQPQPQPPAPPPRPAASRAKPAPDGNQPKLL
ncbi:MAG: exodeoxyribonuclease VII large subunit [Alteraurantiacibacter sp.]